MTVYDVIEKQRAALLAREYQTVKEIVRAYEVAERRVEASIRQFQRKIAAAQAAGIDPSLAWYYQEARLENILREIRMHLDEFSQDALQFADAGRTDAYALGAVHAVRLAEMQVYGDIAGLHSGAFQNAQALLSSTSPLKELFDQIGPTATVKAREVFAKGIAEGWNPRKLGRELSREIDNLSRGRAILIARTEQIRSYRTANREVYQRNADVLRGWRWTAAKTPATCSMCLALDGEIFPVEEVLSSHPACRCSMMPLPKTDFGGPQPSSGEDYFRKLSEKEQDRVIGKGKGKLYREGKITLKDNVRWKDDPKWGRQPTPRPLSVLQQKYASRTLPSQLGYTKVSPFEALPARKLSDLLDAAERKANDPVSKGLKRWDDVEAFSSGDKKPTFKVVKDAPYKKQVGKLADLPSVPEEVELGNLVSTIRWIGDEKVRNFIRNLGDDADLPVVFRSGETLFIHNGDSLARLQAKVMLGQTRTTVRLFDASDLVKVKSPVEEATESLKLLGVKDVEVIAGDEAEVLRTLAFVRERIESTGVVPPKVIVSKGPGYSVASDGRLSLGTDLSDHVVDDIGRATANSTTTNSTPAAYVHLKSKTVRVSVTRAENLEAQLFRGKFDFSVVRNSRKLLEEFGESRYDLFSLRAFETGFLDDAVEEAIILYRRGAYRLGSLPEEIESVFLKQAEAVLGKKKVLAAYSDEENFLFHTVGGQAGSNPGGMYLGRDGVKRYVKFYVDEERSLSEHIANVLYDANGIRTPKSTVFEAKGKKAFATEVLEGDSIRSLGGVSGVDVKVLEDAFDGYLTDAFLSNWDVIGTDEANMLVIKGKVVRIDNGGTFTYRAQGGDKPDSILQSFEDFWSLSGPSGQYGPVLKRLGFSSLEDAESLLKDQAKKLKSTLDGISKTESGWVKYFDAVAPGVSPARKTRMAKMMVERRKLIDVKMKELSDRVAAKKAADAAAKKAAAARAKGRKKFKGTYKPDALQWFDKTRWDVEAEKLVDHPVFDVLDAKLANTNPNNTGSGVQDLSLSEIINLRGLNGKPGAATVDEIKKSKFVAFRGIGDAKFVDDYNSGDLFSGLGYYGSGTYAAAARIKPLKNGLGLQASHTPRAIQQAIDEAKDYGRSRGGTSSGGLIAFIVSDDLKVLDHNVLVQMQTRVRETIRLRRLDAQRLGNSAELKRLADVEMILRDQGRFAALLGFDAIEEYRGTNYGSYLVLLHREKVRTVQKNAWTEFKVFVEGILRTWRFIK